MTPEPNPEFAAFIGIDWADAKHDICLQAAGSRQLPLIRSSRQRPGPRS